MLVRPPRTALTTRRGLGLLGSSARFPSSLAAQFDLLVPPANLTQQAHLVKIRDTTYEEFAVYTPLSADGIDWMRWFFSNRLSGSGVPAPYLIAGTLAKLYVSTALVPATDNQATGTTGQAATVTQTVADATTRSGTWTTTSLPFAGSKYTTTTGDYVEYTITGVERIVFPSYTTTNSCIASVSIKASGVEIDESLYAIPSGHLIALEVPGFGVGLMHHVLAEGLDPDLTYVVRLTRDASSDSGDRLYDGGLYGYAAIAFDAAGVHGIVDEKTLPTGVTTGLMGVPGTRVVHALADCTRVTWLYSATTIAGKARFEVYDSSGSEIASYDNQVVDTYGALGTGQVTVASALTKGAYYLHVIVDKTRNASSSRYGIYDRGAVAADETTAGVAGSDDFDDLSIPFNVASAGDIGTHVIASAGNFVMAFEARQTTDSPGDESFVSGVHGYEGLTTGVTLTVDGVSADYAGAAAGDGWTGETITMAFSSEFRAPSDDTTVLGTIDYTYTFSARGIEWQTVRTLTVDAYLHNNYSIMFGAPNSNAAGAGHGADVGGGMEVVVREGSDTQTVTGYAGGAGTAYNQRPRALGLRNDSYAIMHALTNDTTLHTLYDTAAFQITGAEVLGSGTVNSVVVSRTDDTKAYALAFPRPLEDGQLLSSGHVETKTGWMRAISGAGNVARLGWVA